MSQGRYVSGELVRSVYVVNMSSGGGSGTPGGSDTQIQFNNAGVFGGVANSSVNNATGNITLGSRVSVPLGTAALPSIYPGTDTNTGIYSPGVGQLAVATNGTGRLFINATGKVGIGTTSTGEALQVAGNIQVQANGYVNAGSSAAEISLFAGGINVGSNRGGQIDLVGGNASSDTGIIRFRTGTGAGGTAQSERARIDSSGRLLVGTSSALTTSAGRLLQIAQNDNGAIIALGRNDATVSEGSNLGRLEFYGNVGGTYEQCAFIDAVSDGTHALNDKPTRLVFSTTSDGANSPTERMRITSDAYVRLAAGTGGIQFNGDTAAANALDDYEEGSWTATLSGLTNTSAEFSYFKYTKIGNRVHLQGRFLGQGAAASTGAVTITGVPFTAATLVVATAKAQSPWSAQAGWTDHVQLNSTTLTFKDSNGANSSITSGAISFSFSFTYQV
jgi:hypothetical protein